MRLIFKAATVCLVRVRACFFSASSSNPDDLLQGFLLAALVLQLATVRGVPGLRFNLGLCYGGHTVFAPVELVKRLVPLCVGLCRQWGVSAGCKGALNRQFLIEWSASVWVRVVIRCGGKEWVAYFSIGHYHGAIMLSVTRSAEMMTEFMLRVPALEREMQGYPNDLLSALVERIDLGIIVLDANMCIRHWNSFVALRRGENLEQARGRPFLDVFPEADAARFERMVVLARDRSKHVYNHWLEMPALVHLPVSTGGSQCLALQSTLFFPFQTPDGSNHFGLVIYETSAVAQASEQLELALNALDRKQEEQDQLLLKLDAANRQLLQSEKMAAIGQLAAGVAHEINNPIGYVFSNLRTLDGYVHNLLKIIDAVDGAASLDDVRELKLSLDYDYIRCDVEALLSESGDGIDRVKQIISALKDFSHIEEKAFHLADLHRGLDTTLNIVNNELKYKAEVVKEYGELPEVECILSQINQVMMNLLVNAAHAIEQFGRITLRTACDGEWVWIEVEDTGKGIEPKLLHRIYEPFFTTKPVGKGTGLGLALSYSIMQKHHGRIEVYSDVGKGTRFRVWLPLRQPAASSEADEQAR